MSDSSEDRSWFDHLSDILLREPQDREQLVNLLRDAEQRELIDANALTMLEGVLQVSEMQVRDIMIPRSQMVVVEHDQKPDEFLPMVIESGHSRFPVIGENRDEVIGILLAKDLLSYTFKNGHKPFDIHKVLRPAIFIPESKRLNVLLQEFRKKHYHMSIVVDEYGGVGGLVTIEDVLEQIVGEIEDETDIEEDVMIKKHSETEYIVKAITPIEEFNEYFKTDFGDEEFDTISGLVLKGFGHMPKRNETVNIGDFEFKVLHADNRRIRLVQVTLGT